jgi:acyl CoA:acetate/3-ketoacid CoA transferase beta subunit
MITPVKAWDLIEVGDKVFIHDDSVVVPCTVQKVCVDHLVTDLGWLYYEEHGASWWLTEKIAKEKWEECTKIRF